MIIREEIEKARNLSEKISQFPESAHTIRETMRLLLDARGIISLDRINEEAMNIYLTNMLVGYETSPAKKNTIEKKFAPEVVSKWADNYLRILTDYYFANTFSETLADLIIKYSRMYDNQYAKIIYEVYRELKEKMRVDDLYFFSEEVMDTAASFVEDINVNLIRDYFSDHLSFIGIAKKYFALKDLIEIKDRIYGKGKIGGKAAGILLAKKILTMEDGDENFSDVLNVPEFFVLGSDLCYEFLIHNGLLRYRSYRYQDQERIYSDFRRLQEDFRKGRFHHRTRAYFLEILEQLNGSHYVARSSSRLEDAIGFSFAGKYKSVFCPNQGSREEQLDALERAVKEIYISMYNPAVIAYRAHNHLLDYEERIAVIIQKVIGRVVKDTYFFPTVAGVAFSINPYCWNKKIQREDGMMRIVMGFGSRAVDRVGDDYARMVPLSAPTLRPEIQARDIRKYSQRYVDVMNLTENIFESIPYREIARDFNDPLLSWLVSQDRGDHLVDPAGILFDEEHTVLTFSKFLSSSDFPGIMRRILSKLARHMGGPVDIEFTVEPRLGSGKLAFQINLVQCRRLNWRDDLKPAQIPAGIAEGKRVFHGTSGVPNGEITNVEFVILVDPQKYHLIKSYEGKYAISRIVSILNRQLEGSSFILMGPGRWGSNDVNLGVKVNYGDISNSKMLIEIAYEKGGITPEVSFGTHFFLDLVEGRILVMPLYPDREPSSLNMEMILKAPNRLAEMLPDYESFQDIVRVINIPEATCGEYLHVRLNGELSTGIGYIAKREQVEGQSEDVVLLPM